MINGLLLLLLLFVHQKHFENGQLLQSDQVTYAEVSRDETTITADFQLHLDPATTTIWMALLMRAHLEQNPSPAVCIHIYLQVKYTQHNPLLIDSQCDRQGILYEPDKVEALL